MDPDFWREKLKLAVLKRMFFRENSNSYNFFYFWRQNHSFLPSLKKNLAQEKQTRNYFIPESWKWRPTPSGKRIRVSSWLKCEWQGSMKFDCLFIHFCTTDMKEEGLLGGCGRIAEPAFYEKKAPHIFDWNMLSILCLAILGTLLNFRAWKYN